MACGFTACSDDDNVTDEGASATISISTGEISTGLEGEVVDVTVTSSGDWRLAGVCDWVHPSAESGKSGDVVTFTIDPNDQETMRETVFKFFTGSAIAPLKISSLPGYVLETVGDSSFKMDAQSGELHIKVHTNITDVEVAFTDGGDKWVSFVGEGNAFGNRVFNFTVAKNEGYDDRKTTIVFSGQSRTLEVPLTQQRILAINVPKDYYELDLSAQTLSLDVEANVEYEVKTPEWIKRKTTTRGLETKTLVFDIEASKSTRSGKIYIEGMGMSKVVSVIQKDPNAQVVEVPDVVFKNWLIKHGWVAMVSADLGVVTEAGLTATELDCRPGGRYDPQISSLKGVENFPNLEKINANQNALREVNISKLKKVREFSCRENYDLELINLGDNPVKESAPIGDKYSAAKTLTVIGTQIESLDLHVQEGFYQSFDAVTLVDVSGCPALKTLNCVRGDKLVTLRLKKGQTIPNLTKSSSTKIVYVD